MPVKLSVIFFRFSQRRLWLDRFSRGLQKQDFSSTSSQKKLCRPGPVKLTVSQEKPLIDENLSVSVSGLDSFQEITVMATTASESNKKYTFGSYGHFKASADGLVDLSRDPSLNGTYTGVEPMGLFWSMIQNPNQRQYARLIKYDSTTAVVYNLSVLSQHVSSEYLWRSDLKRLTHTEIQRWYKKPKIKKISVDKKGIYGSLFIPEESENGLPLPAVIDIYGTNGGLIESRAALLASRGFITFSLPYFLYKDLPNTHLDINFEYFQKAIDWFVNHPSVLAQNGIGILGSSFGGTLSFYLAAHCPEVKAAISINGPPAFFLSGIRHNGKKIPSVGIECSTFKEDDQGIFTNAWKIDETKTFTIPASSLAKFLFIVGNDDKLLESDNYKKWLPRNPVSKQSDIELVVYPDTGHLIEPPYTPLFHTCYASLFGCTLRYGGTSTPHAKAQENAWLKIQEFFKKHL